MKEYYDCCVCGKILEKKEVIVLNNKDFYCKKHWKAYLGLSESTHKTGDSNAK